MKTDLKHLRGTLLGDGRLDHNRLRFLTADGVYYRIVKNAKYNLLKNKVGECMRIVARTPKLADIPVLEVVSFSGEFNNLNIEEEMDNFESSLDMPRTMFVDYDSFYT